MKTETIKYILNVDEKTYQYINDKLIKMDSKIGKVYLENEGLIFNLGLYSYYPLLFMPYFKYNNQIKNLCSFSRYYTGWLFILDKIYDDINEYKPEEMLVMSTVLSEAEHILGEIIPYGEKEIYEQVRKFRNINDKTMLKERKYFSYEKEFSDIELFDYCKDKYVIAKLIVYLCYINSEVQNKQALDILYYSHDCYALARQILDEIEDYQEDYNINKFNIYAYKIIKKYGKLQEETYIKSYLIEIAKENFKAALNAVEHLPVYGWKRFLEKNIGKLGDK